MIEKLLKAYFVKIKSDYPPYIHNLIRLAEKADLGNRSHVKGSANQDSDIDLELIFKKLDHSRRFYLQVELMLLASQIDTRIEPHPISQDDFLSENPFVVEIKRTGFEILEKST